MRTIITGAASGIGRAVAEQLVLAGDAQLFLIDRDAAGLEATAAALVGARVDMMVADLADPQQPKAIVDRCVDLFGGIDGIVSNAGVIDGAPLAELSLETYNLLFDVNTRPTWLLGRAALSHLAKSRGAIVATASMAANHPTPPLGSYSASKAALVMLVRQMALEWGSLGVRCNCVSPGPTATPMNPASTDPVRYAQRAAAIPLRKLGAAEDVASAITFLLSAGAAHVTGQDLVVDGGMGLGVMLLPSATT